MPSLGADMDQGTLTLWRVKVGDHVTKGDIIADVDTDKATMEVEVFESVRRPRGFRRHFL